VISRLAGWWRTHGSAALIAVVAGALVIAAVLIWPITDLIAAHDVGRIADPLRAVHLQAAREAVRTQLLTLGAGLFAAGALVYTARNFRLSRRTVELTEQGQVTDRYTRAIEQLGSVTVDVRIGGIYALERMAHDSPRDHPTVMEVLAAFVREHSQWLQQDVRGALAGGPDPRITSPDVQTAITVIGRRNRKYDQRRVNLAGTHLNRANLTGADFTGADLADTNLYRTNLTAATLTNVDLTGANLTEANLNDADLPKANLAGANLTGANLKSANLAGANLRVACLTGANLRYANLQGAQLRGADLTETQTSGVHLKGADLSGALLIRTRFLYENLQDVRLTGAFLMDATLRGTDLTGSQLLGADLTGANLTDAIFAEGQPVPEGWLRDPGSCRLRRADRAPSGP
jgi:uncharacterized protein YjbI with pentapeptide repeats